MDHKYAIPELLQRLIHWQAELAADVPDVDPATGYYLGLDLQDNGGYTCSPLDSIMFAGTGMDGIHYSLLTDFGTVPNLDEAPVIRVSPMDFGSCVRIVAANLRDFFSLHFYGHEGLLLIDFETKEDYLEYLRTQEEEEAAAFKDDPHNMGKWHRQKQWVNQKALEEFAFTPIEDPFSYLQELRQKRKKEIILKTSDSLGIMPFPGRWDGLQAVPHPWRRKEIDPYEQRDEIQAFIQGAECETLLSFIRDYQEQAVNDARLLKLLCQRLEHYGFHLEAARLQQCMDLSR